MSNKRNTERNRQEEPKSSDVITDATSSYFDMLNNSLSRFNKHKNSNKKELDRGVRTTTHRITL